MTPAAESADVHFVAFEGFSPFERSALASFFRLAQKGSHAYVQRDDAGRSDFLIADADHPGARDAVLASGRAADTVFIGAEPPDGAMVCLPRPIDPVRIVRELDALVALRRSAPTLRIEPTALARVDLLLPDLELPMPGVPGPGPAAPAGHLAARAGAGRDVLVVDDSAVARKFLTLWLRRLGYRVHLAHDGEQAVALLALHRFAIAFLDIALGPPGRIDGLQLCQHIKQGGDGPAVMVVTGSTSSSDRVRGSLAGCDAYVTKPLVEAEFIAALCEVDPLFRQAHRAAP